MIVLSVMYPQEQGKKFDVGYYLKDHFALVQSKWGDLMKDASVTRGLSGGAPDAPPTYHIMAHITFGSMDDLKKARDYAASMKIKCSTGAFSVVQSMTSATENGTYPAITSQEHSPLVVDKPSAQLASAIREVCEQ